MAEREPVDVINQFTGEKWYYSPIVKDHFFNPRNIMLEEPDEAVYNAKGMVGSPACIAGATLIQKNPSLESIASLETGAHVFSHDGHFHPVTRIFHPRYVGTLVKIRNPLGELFATLDHLVYAIQVQRKSKFVHTKYKKRIPPSWVHAGDLTQGDIVLYPVPQEVRTFTELKLPDAIKKRWDFRSKEIPNRLSVTPDLLELFGYFVAEGHTTKGREVGFTFNIREMDYVKRVVMLMKVHFKIDAAVRVRPENHRIDIVVYNVHLTRLFRAWFGHSAATKKIPEAILFLPPEIQRGFLKGLWRGDGYFSAMRAQPRAGFVTVSDVLLHQVIWLLLRQDIVPSVYREAEHVTKGTSHRDSYRVHVGDMASLERLADILEVPFRRDQMKRHAIESWFDKGYLYLPVRKVSRIQFDGRLSNIEVASSHTYATDAFLVHNCGDMMSMWLKIDSETERITELKWRTFGCASAIAATSMFSVMVTEEGGMPIGEALKVRPQHIMERLGGLPNRKIHCSVLADKAFRKAANDYFRGTGQHERIMVEGAKVIDAKLNITDRDIEEAVLEGAMDLDAVQQKLKVGIGSPEIITEVEQLIRFYREKYYG